LVLKKIIIFLAFFFFNSVVYAWDFLDEIWEIDFYSSVYENFSFDNNVAKKIGLELWISEKAVLDIYNGSGGWESFKEFRDFCNINMPWNLSSCSAFLVKKFTTEKENENMLFNLKNYWSSNQIWADWDLNNWFFDIIVDLNTIDLILFWEESTELSMNSINWISLDDLFWDDDDDDWWWSWADNPWENWNWTDNWANWDWNWWGSWDGQNWWWDWNWWNDDWNGDWWSDDNNWWNDDWTWESWWAWDYETGDWICIDPLLFKKNKNIENWSGNNTLPEQEREQEREEFNAILDSNIHFWNTNPELADLIFYWNPDLLENSSNSVYWFSDKNKTKLDDECQNSMYWWLICLDWKKCDNEVFCIEINFKKTLDSSFTDSGELYSWDLDRNIWENSCINCLVEFMVKTIKEELLWRTIVARANANKNPSVPNWMAAFKKPFQLISISYKPMSWDKELTTIEDREEEKIEQKLDYTFLECAYRESGVDMWKLSSDLKKCERFEEIVRYEKIALEWSKEITSIKKQKDVIWRFEEFVWLFQAWIQNNVKWFPVFKTSNMKSCSTVWN